MEMPHTQPLESEGPGNNDVTPLKIKMEHFLMEVWKISFLSKWVI